MEQHHCVDIRINSVLRKIDEREKRGGHFV